MTTWTVEQRDGVAELRFTRPPDNFMDFGSLIDLGEILAELSTQADRTRVVMLSSGLGDVFINHAELSDLAKAGKGQATAAELNSWTHALELLEELPQPTLAAIDGLASGGGHELALACTLRVASAQARLQQPEVPIGIVPGGGGSVRLPRLVGPGVAADAILTGREVPADEALRSGWITAILPTEDFIDHAWSWASAVASAPYEAITAAKRLIVDGVRLPFSEAVALERAAFRELAAKSLTGFDDR